MDLPLLILLALALVLTLAVTSVVSYHLGRIAGYMDASEEKLDEALENITN